MTVSEFVDKMLCGKEIEVILIDDFFCDSLWDWCDDNKESPLDEWFEEPDSECIMCFRNASMYLPSAYLKEKYALARIKHTCFRGRQIALLIDEYKEEITNVE